MRVMRLSGFPVQIEHLAAYKAEWESEFDAATAKHGKDQLSLQTELAAIETRLLAKYGVTEELPVSKTIAKHARMLLERYQCPVMIAQSSENKEELVYVVMDQPFT